MRNSKVILAKNIKLDKSYKSVLKYTEAQMIELMTNSNNLVYQSNTYSYIREENIINVKAEYGTCIQANYVAFQNPDYSNKWFFGFINDVRYLNNGVCEIHFTTDIFTTWWSYWSPKSCFTIREHVVDDTIGLHTVPEGLETGEYLPSDEFQLLPKGYVVCVGVSENILTTNSIRIYNNIYSGLQYIALEDSNSLARFLSYYSKEGKISEVYTLFMVPTKFLTNTLIISWDSITITDIGEIKYKEVPSSYIEFEMGTQEISRPSQLGVGNNKYTPKNNKLLTQDYIYILIDNMNGSTAKYAYEYFTNPATCTFKCWGAVTSGCSMKTFPLNYKGIENNYQEGVTNGKLPVCSWISDVYTNWLTQNGVNIGINAVKAVGTAAVGLVTAATGAVTGGVGTAVGLGMMVSGGTSIANSLSQIYEHSLAPNQAEGNLNNGDINFASGYENPRFYKMTIKKEFAEIIDSYYTRMGYKVNTIKVPNMEHRQNFNFVQIGAEENIAYPNNYNNIGIPASALNTINELFRSGITLWNNHENFGDYSVSNNITQ